MATKASKYERERGARGAFMPANPDSPIQHAQRVTSGPTKNRGTITESITGALAGIKRQNGRVPTHETGVFAVTITPEMAGDWLGRNVMNRKLRDRRVGMLAKEMSTGRWADLNGDTIKFAEDGTLLDGQHRLLAVIVANKPIASYVAYGVPKEAFTTFDTGLKRRVTDALFIEGEEDVRELSATLNALYRYLQGGAFEYGDPPSNAELLAVLQSAPGLRSSAAVAKALKRRLPGVIYGVSGCLHYLFNEKSSEDCSYFFEKLSSGTGLVEGDPIYTLRERLVRRMTYTGDGFRAAQEMGVLIIKGWNGFRADQSNWTAKTLRYSEGESLPEIK